METRELRIASGRGRFVDDIHLPGMLHLVFVGSPYAHARLVRVDASAARAAPGVATVLTGRDLLGTTDPLPVLAQLKALGWEWRECEARPLAVDKVRFFGEPIAAVVAETRDQALRAAERVEAEYEVLPAVTSARQALETGSPLLYEEWGDNVQAHRTYRWGDVDAAFARADLVVPVSWREGRASGFPIEPRGCVAVHDPVMDLLVVRGSIQCPFRARQTLAHVLRRPVNRVRVEAVDIGGTFGNKINVWKHTVVAYAALVTGRPVKWLESMREFIATGPHQRDVSWEGEAAVTRDGRLLGLRCRLVQDLGVEVSNRGYAGGSLPAACCALPNAYRIGALEVDAYGVVTNKSFYCAYRGYGKDKGIRFMERVMDRTARACGLPLHEVRRRNFIGPDEFPYEQLTGYVYDSGNYPAVLEKALDVARWEEWREKQREARERGRYLGIGLAFLVEPAGVASANVTSGIAQARIRLTPDGIVEVYSDRTEVGQGAEASHRKVVAQIVGLRPEQIDVPAVTSDVAGIGPVSSRGSVYSLSAVVRAARKFRDKLALLAASLWREEACGIEIRDGVVRSGADPEKALTLAELARKLYFVPGPRGLTEDLLLGDDYLPEVSATWFSPNTAKHPSSTYASYCASADVAVVEVDVETGVTSFLDYFHVHDAGTIIDAEAVDGQIHGGAAQGIGEALFEELVYGEDGDLRTGSYTDYLFPTFVDVPPMETAHLETPSPFTELGTKGMGEAPSIGAKAAVISAIEDALSPLGVNVEEAPATAQRVRGWIRKASNQRRSGGAP
ncbi:MAG: xanthine dehydrogenase family protein molybdopterin-binding subunit [Deltaproteobacteria bacterium]|nr:xanthine dehydrogenase family protein molybdopterin-binding subunit [Deltaproteobacteria bacterium]